MTPRERELCREDMNHDFLTGVFNRRYFETEFCTRLDEWADQHRCASLALVALDNADALRAGYGPVVMSQLVCFVANQWKKHFDRPAERVVCRLADSLFVIGCADKNCKELEEELHTLYGQMPHECVASVGLMKMVPIPQSIGRGPAPVRCGAATGRPCSSSVGSGSRPCSRRAAIRSASPEPQRDKRAPFWRH